MNRLLIISLMSCILITLTACNEKSNSTEQVRDLPSYAPTVIISSADDDKKIEEEKDKEESGENAGNEGSTSTATCEASDNPITEFIRVQTHYGLLFDQPHISSETGGLLPLTLVNDAAEGDLILELDSTVSLVPGQLITYQAQNLDYYVGRISSIDGNTIRLDQETSVVSGITSGQRVWNFYNEATHPNLVGFNAIADYSYRSVVTAIEPGATHVLLGDSWFGLPGFAERISLRFPDANIINKGIGGNTLCDLLARFDTDVAPSAPKYVWINSSINDYYQNVTQEEFKLRLKDLISKVQAIGATAIVLDSAPLNNGSNQEGTSFLTLSRRYATQLLDLYKEALETQ